eukprot:15448422-Alexandrium_andersonii.AAC.1
MDGSSSSASAPSSTNALSSGPSCNSALAVALSRCMPSEGGRSRLGERRQRFPNPRAKDVTEAARLAMRGLKTVLRGSPEAIPAAA